MAMSPPMEAAAEAIAGSIGGFISSAVLFPLDYVKTQQQAGSVKGGFLSVASAILKKDGPLAFYRGAQWRGFQSGYEKIIYFYLFAFARNAVRKTPIENLSTTLTPVQCTNDPQPPAMCFPTADCVWFRRTHPSQYNTSPESQKQRLGRF